MIIFLLIVIIGLLGYLNWQIFKNWTEPRLMHDKLKMERILKEYELMLSEKRCTKSTQN